MQKNVKPNGIIRSWKNSWARQRSEKDIHFPSRWSCNLEAGSEQNDHCILHAVLPMMLLRCSWVGAETEACAAMCCCCGSSKYCRSTS